MTTQARSAKPRIPKRQHEAVPLSRLKPHPKNYRTHSEDQLEHIRESLRSNGVYRNIVIAKDDTILGGHGVVLAALSMGMKEINVIRMPWGPNDPRSLKVLAGDNEISRLAGIDDRALTELLKEIAETDDDLLGTGFNRQMLAALAMVTRTQEEMTDFDAAAEWVGMPEHDPGSQSFRLIVQFLNDDDRKEFLRRAEGLLDEATMKQFTTHSLKSPILSTWWPPREKNDLISIRFEEGDDRDQPPA